MSLTEGSKKEWDEFHNTQPFTWTTLSRRRPGMTSLSDDELDRAIAWEATKVSDRGGYMDIATVAARLAREGWTPPDPLEAEVRRLLDDSGFMEYAIDGPCAVTIRKAIERGITIGRAL